MRLSELFPPEEVLRDEEFEALGLSNSNTEYRILSFLDTSRYAAELNENEAICAVICKAEDVPTLAEHIHGVVLSEQPRRTYFKLHNRLADTAEYCLPHRPSVIPSSCRISPLAYIAPMDVELGENVVVEEFVSIHGPCRIGNDSVLHAGVKLGGSGYEFKVFEDRVLDVAHCGRVEIGTHVILWENVTVHKAVYPWDATVIGDWTRVGAQSHIDHGAKIGKLVKVCAGSVISGRTSMGDHAYIGPGTVLSNRIQVGESAKAALGSVVTKDIAEGETVSGNFAIDHQKHLAWLREKR